LEARNAALLVNLLSDVEFRCRHARLLELEVDQEPEAWRRNVWIQLERMARLAQCALVVAESGQGECESVARLRILRVQLDGAHQRRLRLRRLRLLEQDLAESEPRTDQQWIELERLPVRVHRLERARSARQHDAQVAEHVGPGALLDRAPEVAFGVLDGAAMQLYDREVAARERIEWIQVERTLVGALRLFQLTRLVMRDAQLVPELRAAGFQLEQRAIHLHRVLARAAQQQHLGLRLLHQEPVFASLCSQAELAQRLVVEGLLPERETEVVV